MIHDGGSSAERSFAELLVEESSDALIALSPEGRVLFWSRGAERIFRYSRAQALGRLLDDLIVPHDRRSEAQAELDEVIRAGFTLLETVRRRADGSRVVVDLVMRSVRDGDHLRCISVNATDVSSLVRLRAARAAETRFRGLLEAAPDAMVIVDEDGRIVLANGQTEQMFGYARHELVGQPVELLVPERLRQRHPEHRRAYALESHARPMGAGLELTGRRKDGSEFPAEISLSPMDTGAGRLITAAIRDVTGRRAIESSLKLANHELQEFSYSVAHDLRAPLRGMTGFAQVLLEAYGDKLDAEAHDWLDEILGNARRMSGLIDALLSLSRVARIELKRERVDLTAMARASVSQLAATEDPRSVDVVVREGLHADADPELARKVVDNLLANAWKFTRHVAAPRIEVGVTDDGSRRAFFVRDNGAGFDMAFASKLFVPFQRLHTVGEFPGTGIGLASVQRILQRHGGEIWAEGRIDRGATFYFMFQGQAAGAPP
jgi:PAS domain S-box-containing protein